MSRFNHLEFSENSESEQRASSAAGRPAAGGPDAAGLLQQAEEAFRSGQFQSALRAYSRALEFDPRCVGAWVGQVRMLIEIGTFEEGKRWADKGLEQFPDEPELLAAKAVALGRLGDRQAALAYSDASMAQPARTPYLWLARGDVQLAGEEPKSGSCFERACALAPGDWVVRWLAGRIHYYYRKFALAVRHLQEAIAREAAQGVLWLDLALCQHAMGLAREARESLYRARELSACHVAVDEALRATYETGFWQRAARRCRSWLRP
jgi:tetratricopeptide (TPR) repeat protein